MLNKSCKACFFAESCPRHFPCEDFYPIYDDVVDELIEEVISKRHRTFYEDWIEYIKQFYN